MQTQQQLINFFNDEFPELLQKISTDTKQIWGTMDAQRMIEHLTLAFSIDLWKKNVTLEKVDARADKLKKLFLLSDKPLPKEFQNPIIPAGLQPYENPSLEISKQKLIEEIKNFHAFFISKSDANCNHNLFGNLNYHEWLWFEYKHVNHHFMQFGILELSGEII